MSYRFTMIELKYLKGQMHQLEHTLRLRITSIDAGENAKYTWDLFLFASDREHYRQRHISSRIPGKM